MLPKYRVRPPDLEKRVASGLLACPELSQSLGHRIIDFLKRPDTSLENRLVRGLYTLEVSREDTLNVAYRMERFLRLGRERTIDFAIPLATFGGDLEWGLRSVISELRAGLKAKEEYGEARIEYLKPGKVSTPDFKIAVQGDEQYAEVKSVEDTSIFDVFLNKVESAALLDPRFNAEYLLDERFYFPEPHEKARQLAVRMAKDVDRMLSVLELQLDKLPVEVSGNDLALEFIEKVTVQPKSHLALVGLPSTPFEMMECNARCCDRLSRGILARIVNQVTHAYWKLRGYRGRTPVEDHIYLDVDFGIPPFEEEIKERVVGILASWGIASRVKIHLM